MEPRLLRLLSSLGLEHHRPLLEEEAIDSFSLLASMPTTLRHQALEELGIPPRDVLALQRCLEEEMSAHFKLPVRLLGTQL